MTLKNLTWILCALLILCGVIFLLINGTIGEILVEEGIVVSLCVVFLVISAVVVLIIQMKAVIERLRENAAIKAYNKRDITKEASDALDSINYQYEVIRDVKSEYDVLERYKELLEIGKVQNFTPFIMGNHVVWVVFADENRTGENPEDIIKRAENIDGKEFLQQRVAYHDETGYPYDGDYFDDDSDEAERYTEAAPSLHMYDSDSNTVFLYSDIFIVKIPIEKPWEIPAIIQNAGWNEAPNAEEQVAVFKYWHEKYCAFPMAVGNDTWDIYVEKPVRTKEEALALKKEHFSFCYENVDYSAKALIDSTIWSFWWD